MIRFQDVGTRRHTLPIHAADYFRGMRGDQHRAAAAKGDLGRGLGLAKASLVATVAAALAVSGFASLEALAGPHILGNPRPATDASPYWFAGSLIVLVVLHTLASWLSRRDRNRRRFVWWLVGVSAAGVLWFGSLAALSASFWSAARADVGASDAVATGALYVAALAGPSIASLAAATITALAGPQPASIALPAVVFLVVAGASIAIPVAYSVPSATGHPVHPHFITDTGRNS
jgi:hypothetical protein